MMNLKSIKMAALVACCVASAFAGRKIVVPQDFPTIYAAIGEADEGDTVYVTNGTYFENIALPDKIVLIGQDMLKTIIDGSRRGPVIVGGDDAVISNLTITNGLSGILCKNTRPVIQRCFIVDNKGTGIHALISLPDIRNNVIYRNEWTGIFLESVRGTRTAIDHNVILENGYSGIFCAHRTEVLIRNNIFDNNKQYAVYVAPGSTKSRIIYNNIFNNRHPFNPEAIVNETNVSKEPIYIDGGFPDYNFFLKSVSALKARGENGTDIGLITEQMIESMATDKDGDGIQDDIDQCPDVAEDKDGFQDEDGCPDYDNDNDGIFDAQDKCPSEAEDRDGFDDLDGCPEPDNDKDGILDASDACPNNPETFNGYKDEDGCPDEKPKEITQTLVLRGVNFKTASAELLEESYYVLESVFNSLEAYPNVRIEIDGHTDNQGSVEYNKRLSLERAKSVAAYLVMRGIAENRIVAKGFGSERPVASNDSPEGRAKNRRVEVIPSK